MNLVIHLRHLKPFPVLDKNFANIFSKEQNKINVVSNKLRKDKFDAAELSQNNFPPPHTDQLFFS